MINSVQSGLWPMFLSKDGKTLTVKPIKRPFTELQVKKNQKKVLEYGLELFSSFPLERALNNYTKETIIEEPGMPLMEFYHKEMEKRRRKKMF